MGTKNNPSSYDCYKNAEPDEPMFILLGRDPTAGPLVRLWMLLRQVTSGDDPAKLAEARACAAELDKWAAEKGKQVRVAQTEQLLSEVNFTLMRRALLLSLSPEQVSAIMQSMSEDQRHATIEIFSSIISSKTVTP